MCYEYSSLNAQVSYRGVVAMGPMTVTVDVTFPVYGMRSRVGLRPYIPLSDEGMRIDPPASVPIAYTKDEWASRERCRVCPSVVSLKR